MSSLDYLSASVSFPSQSLKMFPTPLLALVVPEKASAVIYIEATRIGKPVWSWYNDAKSLKYKTYVLQRARYQ